MPSHLYHKHNGLSSDKYAKKYGEFRKSRLKKLKRKKKSDIKCQECNKKMLSHKQLIHHINKEHKKLGWKKYFIKHFFKGTYPTCKCGCGEKVKLIRNGKDEKGTTSYARDYIAGHNTRSREPGYRQNSLEQKQRMREAAIKRMKAQEGTFFKNGPSTGEKELRKFIRSLDVKTEYSNTELLHGKEIDIYLPDHHLGIEYNGGYFHSDLFKDKRYHLNKVKELRNKDVNLIHIWETDWYTKKSILKSMLKAQIINGSKRVYGRKTKVVEVTNKQAINFLERNHLQGPSISKYRYGLSYEDELVALMTFSNLRKATGQESKEGSYELIRFCNKLNYTVVGGASKLFTHFIRTQSPKYILSYANRDWSTGNVYEKLGMTFTGYTPPGYFYTKSRYKFSRFQFQKHKLVEQGEDPNLTEYEIMSKNGYHRIWDTGNLKYEWKQ